MSESLSVSEAYGRSTGAAAATLWSRGDGNIRDQGSGIRDRVSIQEDFHIV